MKSVIIAATVAALISAAAATATTTLVITSAQIKNGHDQVGGHLASGEAGIEGQPWSSGSAGRAGCSGASRTRTLRVALRSGERYGSAAPGGVCPGSVPVRRARDLRRRRHERWNPEPHGAVRGDFLGGRRGQRQPDAHRDRRLGSFLRSHGLIAATAATDTRFSSRLGLEHCSRISARRRAASGRFSYSDW
jgi:hypothetical protein